MKCLLITLPEHPHRTERARTHLRMHGLEPIAICGVNGHKTGLVSTHPYEHDHPGTNYVIGPATIGIWLSHYIAWSIVASGEDDQIMIFEDDVILCEMFRERLARAAADVPPNFDMLFLGSCCTSGHPSTHVAGEVFDVRYPQCLHAYVLTKKAAPVLLTNMRDVYGPIDCLLTVNKFFGLNVYTVLPRLAEQVNTELPP